MTFSTRYGTNFISSILSIGLVLFLLGLIGSIILHGNRLAGHVRENIVITVMLKDSVREAEIFNLQKNLDSNPMVLSTTMVSPEEAAKRLINETGEDFVTFLGYIPLPPSIDVHVKSEFANRSSLEKLETDLKQQDVVKDVYFDKDLTDVVNDNVARISLIIGSIALLLMLISIVLINNTMRLHIYSKRFLIKSMLLVGATHAFVRKPFLGRALWIGFGGGIFSILLLLASISFFQKQIPDLKTIFELDKFALLLLMIMIAGILLSIFSSMIAVRKYVKLDQDSLYK
jgi:cell division transport system permease protein